MDIRRQLQSGRIPAYRSRPYLDWIKTLHCCGCGAPADDPHHRYGSGWSKGAATQASDLWAIPLCRRCHDHLHESPMAWEAAHGSQWFWIAIHLEYAAHCGVIGPRKVPASPFPEFIPTYEKS